MKNHNLTVVDLIDEMCDRRLGHIPVKSLETFLSKLPGIPSTSIEELYEALEVAEAKVGYRSFINLLKGAEPVTLKNKIENDLVSVLTKQKK